MKITMPCTKSIPMGLLAELTLQKTLKKINGPEDIAEGERKRGKMTEQNKQKIFELWDKFKKPNTCVFTGFTSNKWW